MASSDSRPSRPSPRSRRERCAHDAPRRRDEQGSVLPFVALAATSLLLFLVLALDSGRVYLARTQLQIASDNAARAALSASYDDPSLTPLQAREAGVRAAQDVLSGNRVIDGGARLGNQQFSFGLYDFATSSFSEEALGSGSGSARPAAVRVRLDRSRESGGAFQGLFTPIGVQVESIATLRCRDVSIALDLSGSFQSELGAAQDALRSIVDSFARTGGQRDRLALVSFNREGTQNGAAGNPDAARVEAPLADVASTRASFDAAIDALQVCTTLSGCGGTNTASGIDAARQQLENAPPGCPGDQMIILITDGVPCDTSVPQDNAAFRRAALSAADDAEAAGFSLSTIFVFLAVEPQAGSCPASDERFAGRLVRGDLGQALNNAGNQSIDQLLNQTLGNVPVVMVN